MNSLKLPKRRREFLERNRELFVNADGDETLLGLNPEESAIYLEHTINEGFDPTLMSSDELVRFIEIYERHAKAMLPISQT